MARCYSHDAMCTRIHAYTYTPILAAMDHYQHITALCDSPRGASRDNHFFCTAKARIGLLVHRFTGDSDLAEALFQESLARCVCVLLCVCVCVLLCVCLCWYERIYSRLRLVFVLIWTDLLATQTWPRHCSRNLWQGICTHAHAHANFICSTQELPPDSRANENRGALAVSYDACVFVWCVQEYLCGRVYVACVCLYMYIHTHIHMYRTTDCFESWGPYSFVWVLKSSKTWKLFFDIFLHACAHFHGIFLWVYVTRDPCHIETLDIETLFFDIFLHACAHFFWHFS
jgi:hypothetical protein